LLNGPNTSGVVLVQCCESFRYNYVHIAKFIDLGISVLVFNLTDSHNLDLILY